MFVANKEDRMVREDLIEMQKKYEEELVLKKLEKEKLTRESSFYQKLSYGLDVNILVVGDSIGANSGASSSDNYWTNKLQRYIRDAYMLNSKYGGTVKLKNVSMGGNSSYAGYVRTLCLDDEVDYDLIVFCYGQNDSIDKFEIYYEAMVRAGRKKYPNASIISILESSQRDYTPKMKIIQDICASYNIPIADTIASFNSSRFEYDELSKDGVHPNDMGYELYFETVKNVIDENVKCGTGKLGDVDLQNEGTSAFNKFVWYGKKGDAIFRRIDDCTYQISGISAHGIMGIDYAYQSGNNKAEIYIDGVLYKAPTVYFDYDFSQRRILVVGFDLTVNEKIKIVFETKKQADEFNGVCFSWE